LLTTGSAAIRLAGRSQCAERTESDNRQIGVVGSRCASATTGQPRRYLEAT
jgi:hypothetical protein